MRADGPDPGADHEVAAGDTDEADGLDDAALAWEGDEALGRATSLTDGPDSDAAREARARAALARAERRSAELGGVEGADAAALSAAGARPRDPAALAIIVPFGVVYLAWEVLWIVAIARAGSALLPGSASGLLGVLASLTQFLALIAAALWFLTAVRLTRGAPRRQRIGWLALGLLVTLPWPFLSGFVG